MEQSEVSSTPDKREAYPRSLNEFEELFDKTPAGRQLRQVGDKITIPEWITVVREVSTEGRVNLGVFWPREVFEKIEQRDLKKEEEDIYTHLGKKLKGIIRDAKHGTPQEPSL